jgi:hypothetical protein
MESAITFRFMAFSKNDDPSTIGVPSPGESHLRRERHGHQELRGVKEVELSPVNKVHRERGISL